MAEEKATEDAAEHDFSWENFYKQQQESWYTHIVILAVVANPVTEQGKRESVTYYYGMYRMQELNVLQFPSVKIDGWRFIPISPGNHTMIEYFQTSLPAYDHTQKPYPDDWWDVKP